MQQTTGLTSGRTGRLHSTNRGLYTAHTKHAARSTTQWSRSREAVITMHAISWKLPTSAYSLWRHQRRDRSLLPQDTAHATQCANTDPLCPSAAAEHGSPSTDTHTHTHSLTRRSNVVQISQRSRCNNQNTPHSQQATRSPLKGLMARRVIKHRSSGGRRE